MLECNMVRTGHGNATAMKCLRECRRTVKYDMHWTKISLVMFWYSVSNGFPVTRWLTESCAYQSLQSVMASHSAVEQLKS